MDYYKSIEEAVDYIEYSLFESISLEVLAENAHISKFHFHRIFKALTGYSVAEYIDRRVLNQVCYLLRETDLTILDIALDCGFNSHEVLTRKFKKYFGISPQQYRLSSDRIATFSKISMIRRNFLNRNSKLMVQFDVMTFGRRRILGKICAHRDDESDPEAIGNFLFPFADKCFQNNPDGHLYLAVLYHEKKYDTIDYFVGFDYDPTLNGYEIIELPASDYAVFTYKGVFRENIRAITEEIYRSILASDYAFLMGGVELIEVYNQRYLETNEFEIQVPIKKKIHR